MATKGFDYKIVIIHDYLHVREDALQAFLEQTKPLITSTALEPGNISYTLYRDVEREGG